jgi:hypothetical protein
MDLPPQFTEFLKNIRLTDNQRGQLQAGHKTLRDRLAADEDLREITVSTFLQGSYVRHTAVRPKDEQRADVDIIVVTNLSEDEYTPGAAMDLFVPFLDKHYKDKYRFQGRSIGIEMSNVDLDIVLTSAPSEVEEGQLVKAANAGILSLNGAMDLWFEEAWAKGRSQPAWKLEPLRIPDRDADDWQDTHPLEQIRKTQEKNKACNTLYVNVVKAFKWWRRLNQAPKHPKGYPLEHLVWVCCPDGIESMAEGVVYTLEEMVRRYEGYAAVGLVPEIRDHGVDQNVLRRVSAMEFKGFMGLIQDAADLARRAYDSTSKEESGKLWQELFGSRFPEPPKPRSDEGAYTPRKAPTTLGVGTFG